MTEGIPSIDPGIDEFGRKVVIVAQSMQTSDLATLIATVPGLLQPDGAATMARAVAHLAAGSDYRVIDNPSDYETAYRAQLEQEDPAVPRQDGVLRLRDHGIPDFAAIHAPAYAGTILRFFARNDFPGLPYRADIDPAGVATDGLSPEIFRAVALWPLPSATATPPLNPEYVGALGTPVSADDVCRLAKK